ncbi:hypothetical protein Syun_029589 [Stephania yunnanensis]|uniref:CRM domain-containing protein n=1 Tax=Stephania yunnanensis TaxID=152371 RepID=A0AAP0HLI2_9MAGN
MSSLCLRHKTMTTHLHKLRLLIIRIVSSSNYLPKEWKQFELISIADGEGSTPKIKSIRNLNTCVGLEYLMSLALSRQSPLASSSDPFQSSFRRFHAFHRKPLRYSPSFYFSEKYPPRNSGVVLRFKSIRWNHSVGRACRPKFIKGEHGLMDLDVAGDGEVLSECNDDEGRDGDGSKTVGGKMGKIMEKLKGFGYAKEEANEAKERLPAKKSLKYVFYAEEGNSKGGFSRESQLVVGKSFGSNGEGLVKVEVPLGMDKEGRNSGRWRRRSSLAELTLPDLELRRLRNLSVWEEESIDIGVLGVTQAIVDMIHEKWKTAEVVRLNCHAAHAPNMRRMHEMLEGHASAADANKRGWRMDNCHVAWSGSARAFAGVSPTNWDVTCGMQQDTSE